MLNKSRSFDVNTSHPLSDIYTLYVYKIALRWWVTFHESIGSNNDVGINSNDNRRKSRYTY